MDFIQALKNHFFSNSSTAAIANNRIPLLDASGNPIGSDTRQNIEVKEPLYTGNVMFASLDGDYLRFRPMTDLNSYKSTAVGAAIIEGGRTLIIAKDESSKQWATDNVTAGTGDTDRAAAIADFNGKTKTDAIKTALGDNAPAAKYCLEYYPTGITGVTSGNGFVGAGHWWLPSMGELVMIWAHIIEVNRVLSAIGGTPINMYSLYWSSTEYSAKYAWHLGTYNRFFYNGTTKTSSYPVRPVSAFD